MAFIQNNPDDQGQNQNNLNQQQEQPQGQPNAPIQTNASAPGAPAGGISTPTPQAPPQQQKGSGRFTNLQKYVQANTGAGERLASGVNRQIEQGFKPLKQETQKTQQATQQGLQQGQQRLQQGQGLQQQMQAPDFTPQRAIDFVNQGNNLQEVSAFRTGQGVDEAAIQKQNEAFQQATANLGQQVNQRGQQVGSEIGRINLLKEAFGGRNRGQYTTGASRLDNLLLQSGPQNLQALTGNIQSNRDNIRTLQQKAVEQGKTLEQVIADESALQQGIQGVTAANVDRFKTDLGGQVTGFNQQIEDRLKEGNQFVDFYNKAVTDQQFKDKYGVDRKDYQFNRDLFSDFGLQRGQQTFNVFNNRDLNLGQVAEIEGRRAQDWRDVATQQNVTEYDALARLKGLTQPEFELAQASEINREGYKRYEDERGLQGRINKAREDFLKQAGGQLIEGATGFVEGVKGTGAVSLADYLRNPDYYNRAQVRFERDDGSTYGGDFSGLAQFGLATNTVTAPFLAAQAALSGGGNLSDISGMTSNLNQAYQNATGPLGQLIAPTQIISDLSRNLFGGGGGQDYGKGEQYVQSRTVGRGIADGSESSFLGAATGQALQNFLASQGFGNYLTEGGVKTSGAGAQDLARQFGYRSNVQGEGIKEGFYNPMFERERIMQSLGLPTGQMGEQSTQIAGRSGPMTAEEALANRPTGETPQQRLTREQIAAQTRTSTDAERAALRQELIGQNAYQTSNPEFQEILAREQSRIGSGLEQNIQNELLNQYLTQRGDQEGRIVRENFGSFNNGMPQAVANAYFTQNRNNLGLDTNALSQSAQADLQRALQSQIYGTTAEQLGGGAAPTVDSQAILNRILGGSGGNYDQTLNYFNQAIFNRNRGYVPVGF